MSVIAAATQMCLGSAVAAFFIGVVVANISHALRKALEDRTDGA
jgi:hypothetical protein